MVIPHFATGKALEAAMSTGWNEQSRDDVLHRIEALAAEFLECLADEKILVLEALKRDSSAMIYDEVKQQQFHGNETRLIKLVLHHG
ncbi:hypothetical protein V7S43_013658 [Phytophthora oleae]|uniref:Uncharacterized protein n=1 Tax=Phytophthora oleae TaxID=2107226 RepID=A0ABD3F3R6_9STRA